MDVTCERCATEYEFDETLVSDRGTTVKCTNCGHLFKVFRPESIGAAKSWHVEQVDGTTRTLGTLKELQRLIADGVLSPHDRISRGSEPQKRLGEIAELSTFFEAAATVVGDPPRPRRSTAPGRGPDSTSDERPLSRTLDGAAVPPMPSATETVPARRPKATMMGIGALNSDPPPRSDAALPPRAAPPPRPAPSRPPPPPRPPRRADPPPPVSDADVTAPHRPVRVAPLAPPGPEPPISPAPVSAPSAPPPEPARGRGLYLDAHEPAAPPRAKSRSGLWVTLVVLLALGVGVALGWPQIAPLLGLSQPADPALPHVEAGDAALALDHVPGYESAITHYTQALAHDGKDARVLTRLSRAQALWAQALLFDATDLEARAGEDPALGGEAAAIRREVSRHAEAALARGQDAVRHGAGDVDAEVALADALRLTGDLARARSRLDRALSLRREASAETLRVQALIEAAEGGGDLAPVQPRAEQAVAEDPAMIRARLLAARALLAARDVGGARQQIDAILRRNAQHPAALGLRSAIDEGRPPAPPTLDVPDGGPAPDAGVAPAPAPEPEVAVSAPAPTPAPSRGASREEPAGSGAIPPGRDYSWYVRNGDEQRQRGDLARARAFYEAARQVRPGGSEALTGLGHAELSGGNAQAAASLFRQAAGQGYAEAYIGLGDAYRRLGRTQDALTSYERYLERLPGGPHAAQAQQSAAQLRQQLASAQPEPAEPSPPPSDPAAPEPAPSEPAPAEPAPSTPPEALPPPRDMESPPPRDVPAVESDPEYQP